MLSILYPSTSLALVKTGCIFIILLFLSLLSKAQPVADFSATPVSGCSPLVVNFSDHSTHNPTQWKWDLGNGTLSFLQNPSVTYFNPGQYSIKLVVKNAAGADSITRFQYITVFAQPVVNFTGSPLTGCFPLPVQFNDLSTTASGNISQWQWDFGDGNISSVQNPAHIYTGAGNFNVTLKVQNSKGCFKTLTMPQYIHISNGVNADFTNTIQSSCTVPANINFLNLSTGTGALTYLWNFGDGNTSVVESPSHVYNSAGSYTVQLIATNSAGCSDTITTINAINVGNVHSGFSMPDSICINNTYTITNTSSPTPVSSSWDFGNGIMSTAINPTVSYPVIGSYVVKLINNFGACIDSVTKNITVFAKPVSAFSAAVTKACYTPFTVNFTNSTTGAVSYQWNFGDGNTSTQINASHTYIAPGIYTVKLVSTNASGCTDTLIKTQYIKIQLPVVTIDNLPQEGCAPFGWTFSASVNSIEPIQTYHWNFGDGTTSILANPFHNFAAGVYTIQLIVTTASGCTDTVTAINGITAYQKPVGNFIADPRDVCAHIGIQFTDLTTPNATQWLWFFGDGDTSTLQNPMHIYEDTGYMNVTLVVWNHNCADTITLNNYIHISPPIAAFSINFDCAEPFKRKFNDFSIGADEWRWDFGDGGTSTIPNPQHIYAAPGDYAVSLTVKNFTTGCTYTTYKTVRIIIEKAQFTISNVVTCRTSPVVFTATGSNPNNIISYLWKFGDGSTATTRSVSHAYLQPGSYDVTLIITDTLGCKDTLIKSQSIRINGPKAQFTASTNGACLLTTILLTDASLNDGIHPITQWRWNYGDGIIETLGSGPFQHTYNAPGIYTVRLTVTDNSGCSDSIIKPNLLTISKPVAGFTADTVSCPGKPIHFNTTSTGPGLIYHWYFGDGNTSTTANPVYSYSANGIYTVKLVIYDQYGCSDSITKSNYIKISTPFANFNVSDSVGTCPPLIVAFTNTSQNYTSVNWDFGDGNSASIINPTHFYNIPGNYIAILTITGPGGCTSVKEQHIKISGPYGTFSYGALSGCKPLTVDFIANTSNRSSFIWDFNDGTTISTTDSVISHTYTIPGIYVPKMILVNDAGCMVPIIGSDTIVVHDVTAGLNFNSQTLCNAGNVQFNNTTVSNDLIVSYQWNFGDGTTAVSQSPAHQYNSTGLYFPSLIVITQSGCIDSVKSAVPVKIVRSPEALINQSANGCTPVTITISGSLAVADTSAVTWNWNFGNGHTSTVQNPPSEIYNTAGIYGIRLLVQNSSGCIDTVSTTIKAFAIPVVNAGLDTFVCKGSTRTLNATGAANYIWSPATALSCTACANPAANPDSMITYFVKGTSIEGCSNKDSVTVKVKYPFRINYSKGDTLCKGSSVNLAAIGAENYTWSPAAGLNTTSEAIVTATPLTSTVYQVIGRDNKNCFSDTAFIPIKVFDIPVIDAGPDKTVNVGQTLDLIPVISSDVIKVMWTPTGSIFRSSYPSITVKPRETTTYDVVVKNAGGCSARDNVTVNVICNGANVFIPNTFSPNGDGINDIFYPRGTGLFNIHTAKIFNRWGELVYEKREFAANDAGAGWDGTYKGKKLNVDVYIYVIEILCDNNTLLTYKGNITLIQ